MTTTDCPFCGLKRWDADDLTAGDEVCVCDEDDWTDNTLPAEGANNMEER